MKELLIDKEIGGWFGLYPDEVTSFCDAVKPGEDITIKINSPGGDFFAMVPIFNAIRNLARKKENRIDTYIYGMAASCASMIALAAKAGNQASKIIVEDNSIFMIHNCWCVDVGDHREFSDMAKALQRIDELQRDIYERATGKTRAEIAAWMDDDTYFYGQEIIDAGFADELPAEDSMQQLSQDEFLTLRASSINDYKSNLKAMKAKYASKMNEANDVHASAVAACAKVLESMAAKPLNKAAPAANTNTEEVTMTLEELKSQCPDVYAAACKEGADAERERIQAHLKMAGDSGDLSAALPYIESGAQCSENAVVAAYHETFCKTLKAKEAAEIEASAKKLADMRAAENPAALVPPAAETEEDAELKAFKKSFGVRG